MVKIKWKACKLSSVAVTPGQFLGMVSFDADIDDNREAAVEGANWGGAPRFSFIPDSNVISWGKWSTLKGRPMITQVIQSER